MITTRLILIILSTLIMLFSTNPVKTSITILISAIIRFLLIFLTRRKRWYPIIYFLIFIGGILVLFIILSSILPNEPIKNNKLKFMAILRILSIIIGINIKTENINSRIQIKATLISRSRIYLLVGIILIYFFTFILILSKEKEVLRSFECH